MLLYVICTFFTLFCVFRNSQWADFRPTCKPVFRVKSYISFNKDILEKSYTYCQKNFLQSSPNPCWDLTEVDNDNIAFIEKGFCALGSAGLPLSLASGWSQMGRSVCKAKQVGSDLEMTPGIPQQRRFRLECLNGRV